MEFNYAENVIACVSWGGMGNGQGQTAVGSTMSSPTSVTPYSYDMSFPTRDVNQINYECHEHYSDAEGVCGQDGHDYSNPFWRCNTK